MARPKLDPLALDCDPVDWARGVAKRHKIVDAKRLRILREAVVALHEAMAARSLLLRPDGTLDPAALVFETQYKERKPHPAIRIAHNASLRFTAAMRTLDISDGPPETKNDPFAKFAKKRK